MGRGGGEMEGDGASEGGGVRVKGRGTTGIVARVSPNRALSPPYAQSSHPRDATQAP